MNYITNRTGFRKIKNRDTHKCFGCSPINDKGLKMKFYTDDTMVLSWLSVPDYLCGWDNVVHGGILSTILDEVMSWSSIFLLKSFILTKSITVDFLKPVLVDTDLQADGSIIEKLSDREAHVAGRIINRAGELCAQSRGTFALYSPEAMTKKHIFSDELIESFQDVFTS